MTQAYQAQQAAGEAVSLAFKRHILESSSGFVSEPMADAYRVNLLAGMLDRYDALRAKGMSEQTAMRRTMAEYDDIAAQMRDMGFEEALEDEEVNLSRWPQLSEDEAQRYIRERDAYMHRTAMGIFMCVACLAPMMILVALSEIFWLAEDFFAIFGVIGMFAMIGLGVYMMVTAVKPKDEKRIKKRRFSLGQRLRRKLTQMQEAISAKARRRKGKGVALCVMSVIPIMIGAAFSEIWYTDFWPVLGVAGMFLMIATGVYQLVMADGEKKTMKRLLNTRDE